jgi:hypothetical protein
MVDVTALERSGSDQHVADAAPGSAPLTGARYCGREFSAGEFEMIRRLIDGVPRPNRYGLSRRVCEVLDWRKPDGGLKDMSCRVALLRMAQDGLFTLPAPLHRSSNSRRPLPLTDATAPELPVRTPAGQLRGLHLEAVVGKAQSGLWNEYIERYHYLGHQPLPGAQLRYFARTEEQIVALLGFSAAAWKTAPRDVFIGWTPAQREERLRFVVNNARFLILPWVASKHLASKVLGLAARQLPGDWHRRYSYRPVLLETFVEKSRFAGTSYKAANWKYLGDTQGRGKLDRHNRAELPVKSVWVYPLSRGFRRLLSGEASPS